MLALNKTILKNRYETLNEISRGGMGRVLKAHDTILDITVAVKELFNMNYQSVEQFETEAKILARLNHPNLPRVTDFFQEKKKQYLVMDFISGDDLQKLMENNNGFLSEKKVLPWITDVLKILDYVHSHGIIHRDIKPSNIKLTPEGKIILVDFGIAKMGINGMTAMGAMGFTPYIAPPEQYTSTGTGVYSDIYAMGATMYYLLTGKLPAEAISRMMGTELINPTKINPSISINTEKIILKSMEIAPDRRYGSAKEMMEQIINITSFSGKAWEGSVSQNIKTGFRRDIRR